MAKVEIATTDARGRPMRGVVYDLELEGAPQWTEDGKRLFTRLPRHHLDAQGKAILDVLPNDEIGEGSVYKLTEHLREEKTVFRFVVPTEDEALQRGLVEPYPIHQLLVDDEEDVD